MGFTWKGLGKKLQPLQKLAKVAALPVGFINPAAGMALGGVSGLGHGKDSVKSMAGGVALGAGGAALGKLANVKKLGVLGGLQNLGGKVVNAGSKVGNTVLDTLKDQKGGFDLSKLASLGLAGSALKGSRDENNAANKFNAENAAMRQALMEKLGKSPDYSALMERIMSRPNYNL